MSCRPGAFEVAALYTRRTRSYVRYVQAFGHRQGLQALLEALPPPAPAAGERVLDAGCGTGLSVLAIRNAARHYGVPCLHIDAFDLTPAMLDACRASLEERGLRDVELRQADICQLDDQLPAAWNRYDLIVCASMLEHLPPPALPAALAALGRSLAPVTFFVSPPQGGEPGHPARHDSSPPVAGMIRGVLSPVPGGVGGPLIGTGHRL